MRLLLQVIALPVALYLVSVSTLIGPTVTPQDVQAALEALNGPECPSSPVLDFPQKRDQDRRDLHFTAQRLANLNRPCQNWATGWGTAEGGENYGAGGLGGSGGGAKSLPQETQLCRVALARVSSGTGSSSGPFQASLLGVKDCLCGHTTVKELMDAAALRRSLEDLKNVPLLGSVFRGVLTAYDHTRDSLLGHGYCAACHGLNILFSVLRVHLLLLAVGLAQDIVECFWYCGRRCLHRSVGPLMDLLSCAGCLRWGTRAAASSGANVHAPVVFEEAYADVLGGQAPPLAAVVRRRTRAALEALAQTAMEAGPTSKALSSLGLRPEDLHHHARVLSHIQEHCTPMATPGASTSWWLASWDSPAGVAEAEAAALGPECWRRTLRRQDVFILLGLLLPLPSVLWLVEMLTGSGDASRLLAIAGVLCAGHAGLLERRSLSVPWALLRFLSISCALLGAFVRLSDGGTPVLSAGLLALVELRPTAAFSASYATGRVRKGRAQLATDFALGYMAGAALQALQLRSLCEFPVLAAAAPLQTPRWAQQRTLALMSAVAAAPQARAVLGYAASFSALASLRYAGAWASARCRNWLALSFGLLLAAIYALLLEGSLGLPLAFWWLAACEVAANATATPVALQLHEPAAPSGMRFAEAIGIGVLNKHSLSVTPTVLPHRNGGA